MLCWRWRATLARTFELSHQVFNRLTDPDCLTKGRVEFLARLFTVERERQCFTFPNVQFRCLPWNE